MARSWCIAWLRYRGLCPSRSSPHGNRHALDRHHRRILLGALPFLESDHLMPPMPRSILLTSSLIIAGLAGCAGGSPQFASTEQQPLVWVRTDGQSGKANPALADQFSRDREACGVNAQADNTALLA